MDDYNIPQLINALLSTVKTMNERLGVPTVSNDTPATIIGVDPDTTKANTWGKELQIGKYFPNDTQASFLKPLFTGLNLILSKYFDRILPVSSVNLKTPTNIAVNNQPQVPSKNPLLAGLDSLFVKFIGGLILPNTANKSETVNNITIPDTTKKVGTVNNTATLGNNQISFLTPLFTGLNSLFAEVLNKLSLNNTKKIDTVTSSTATFGGKKTESTTSPSAKIGVERLLMFDSESLVKLSTNLGLAVPGLVAFKNIDWEFVLIGIEYLDNMFVDLTNINQESFTSLKTSENILAVSKNLGLAGIGFMSFKAVNWVIVSSAITSLYSILSKIVGPEITNIVTTGTELLKNFAMAIGSFGLALLPVAFGLTAFSAVSFGGLVKAGIVISTMVAGIVAFSKIGLPLIVRSIIPLALLSAGIAAFGFALIPLTNSLKDFNTIDLGSLAKAGLVIGGLVLGIIALSGILPIAATGAGSLALLSVGIAALGFALIPLTSGLAAFNTIDWGTLAKAGLVISGLVVGITALGAFLPVAAAGAAALALIGGGIAVFGAGVAAATYLVGLALTSFSNTIALFGKTLQYIAKLPLETLPAQGSAIGGFLTNLASGIGFWDGTKLAALTALLPVLATGLTGFGVAVNSLTPVFSTLSAQGSAIASFLSNFADGIGFWGGGKLTALTALIPVLSTGLTSFGVAVNRLAPVYMTLPAQGSAIASFLTNLASGIGVVDGVKLTGFIALMPVLSTGLTAFSVMVNNLAPVFTTLLPMISTSVRDFGTAVDQLYSVVTTVIPMLSTGLVGLSTTFKQIAPIITTLLPTISSGFNELHIAMKQLTPDLSRFETFLHGFVNIDIGKLKTVSNELVASFTPVAASITGISDAINDINFTKLGMLTSNLGKVAVNVNTFGPEMEKTNTVLAEQLYIQKQQLTELKNQTILLSKLKISDSAQTSQQSQQSPSTPSFYDSTRMNYQNSAYYAKSS